jgi:hypothetical protein
LGIVVGSVGLIAVGVGAAFGFVALTKNNDAELHCPASPRCDDPEGVTLTNDAKNAATVSTISFAAGGVLMAAGALLFFTAPSSDLKAGARTSAPHFALGLAPAGLGPGLGGSW